MRLGDILSGCHHEVAMSTSPHPPLTKGEQGGEGDTEISGIAYDSRKVMKGNAFVAIDGDHFDGHDFIRDAVGRGAAAVVYERDTPPISPLTPSVLSLDKGRNEEGLSLKGGEGGFERGAHGEFSNPSPIFIRVNDSRRALACLSNNFFGRPSETLSVIGVTGTNGKTTTTYLIKSILEAWRWKVGLIGTIRYSIVDREYPAVHTTPESLEFQSLLSEMASAGCSHVVTEVSSHALSQGRVDYTRFVAVVFTNLTRDHLDFHETMENYFTAKRGLFTELLSEAGTAMINVDDEWGRRLLTDLSKRFGAPEPGRGCPSLITYGIEREADVMAAEIKDLREGVSFALKHGDRSFQVASPLIGGFNVYNILAAASVGIALNVPMEAIEEGIGKVNQIKGRFEKIDLGQDFLCIVDYAHTPDALERLINAARELLNKSEVSNQPSAIGHKQKMLHDSRFTIHDSPRIITVFGCGGDRDKGKRPIMGEIATRLSNYVIITSDNPRSENPSEIIKDIVSGIYRDNYLIVPDRGDAITTAVKEAGAGDIVLIAGKGHEDYQEIGGIRYMFSDREVAEEAIRNKNRE